MAQSTPAVAQSTPAVAQSTPAVAQSTAAVAQSTTAVAQSTASVAQSTPAVAQSTTAVAQSTTAVAQSTTAVAQTTAAVAQSTAAVVQNTATVVQNTATVAQNTAAVAQSTATVAQTTTAAPTDPTNPAPKERTTADPKLPSTSGSQSAIVGGAGVAPATEAADTVAASAALANDEATSVIGLQSLREQHAQSAVETLSQSTSANDTNATATQAGNSPSGPTAAAPQTVAQNSTAAGSGSSTTQTADTTLSQADRVRFVQRVEQAFQDMSGQGGSIRLRLSPPELGSLRIEINVSKGAMTARVEAETPAARNILLDNLPALRERLAQQDIKVQRFDVDLMDRSGSGMSNQSSQYQDPSQNPSAAVVRAPFRGSGPSPDDPGYRVPVEAAPWRPVKSKDT